MFTVDGKKMKGDGGVEGKSIARDGPHGGHWGRGVLVN